MIFIKGGLFNDKKAFLIRFVENSLFQLFPSGLCFHPNTITVQTAGCPHLYIDCLMCANRSHVLVGLGSSTNTTGFIVVYPQAEQNMGGCVSP